MKNLNDCLNSTAKTQFFDRLSVEAYADLPADLLSLFEGPPDRRHPYVIFDALPVSAAFCRTIREAAQQFWQLATSTAEIFQYLPEAEILEWGYPEDYIPQILADNTAPSEMRLDIAVNPVAFAEQRFQLSDFKILEANSATPGFWAETFVLNQLIVNHLGHRCVNQELGAAQTQDFIAYLKASFPGYAHGRDIVYFSFPDAGAHEDIVSFDARIGHFEQLGGKARFLYTEDLILETDVAKQPVLLTNDAKKIRYLFLHYPNEWLLEDRGDIFTDDSLHSIAAARPWDYLQQLVLQNELFRVPPIRSEIIQNKAFYAFLWDGVQRQGFDPDTTQLIQALVPPTYCTPEEALSHGLNRIWEKPIYGREGAGIILWEDGHELVNTYDPNFDDDDWYQNMLAVFQQDCPMPTHEFADQALTLMFTVYLSAQGRATGIGCRAVTTSEQVIDSRHGLWYPLAIG